SVAQVLAAEHHHEPVLADRLDEGLDAGNLDSLQLLAHRHAAFGTRPAGAAVADQPLGVHRAEVSADRHVFWPDLKINAQRFKDAPADLVFERIVAEQTEVPRSAAGGDAGQHGDG